MAWHWKPAIPARSCCNTQYLVLLRDYAFFEFQVGFYFLVRRGNLISFSLFSFRAFANVVRSWIYFVSFLVQYYSQEATIIVFGKISSLLHTQI